VGKGVFTFKETQKKTKQKLKKKKRSGYSQLGETSATGVIIPGGKLKKKGRAWFGGGRPKNAA